MTNHWADEQLQFAVYFFKLRIFQSFFFFKLSLEYNCSAVFASLVEHESAVCIAHIPSLLNLPPIPTVPSL